MSHDPPSSHGAHDPAHGAHEHPHDAVVGGDSAPSRALALALLVTLAFAGAEAAGGVWTGSLALLADAGHMLSDAAALGIAWLASFIARRPADQHRTMGYRRAEVLGALVNATTLGLLAIWIVVEAVHRLAAPPEVKGLPMMIIATLGLLVNLGLARILHGAHSHDGHDHLDLNVRAALWHVIGDALGSVGAMVAGLLLWWKGWALADPIVSVAIAGILVVGGGNLAAESLRVLMQSSPRDLDLRRLEAAIRQIPGVQRVHQLHVWILTPGEDVLTVHVVVDDEVDVVAVTTQVRQRVVQMRRFVHVTVQPERPAQACDRQ